MTVPVSNKTLFYFCSEHTITPVAVIVESDLGVQITI